MPREKSRTPHSNRQGIQVIARAAAVLRALEDEPEGLSLGQLAQRVNLARSTVQRIVAALADEHLLIAAAPSAGVKLGPALVRLASSANVDIDQLVRPALSRLSKALKETVDLSQLKGSGAIFIDQIPGEHRLRAVSAIGESFPLHCTANGKALLSLLPDEKWTKLIGRSLRAHTAHTITDIDTLHQQIQECRRTHITYDREEHTEGIAAVGTAFLDPIGRPLAISIPVPTTRFGRIETKLVTELRRTRKEIEALLGR
ncbi:MAG TPA: IclR family transcriptional regulator [Povalibacter sp.]|uniref:IclR family transcriptional regulator n=1 Tax=Povalibacter sp. TaxID=1962978 RepID=UPI002C6B0123|nr:IclR family transcriptional regulator [Povalibacter sp.]HMN43802.1 IclR family transcriptional regulator [Povalibacter sp.]